MKYDQSRVGLLCCHVLASYTSRTRATRTDNLRIEFSNWSRRAVCSVSQFIVCSSTRYCTHSCVNSDRLLGDSQTKFLVRALDALVTRDTMNLHRI